MAYQRKTDDELMDSMHSRRLKMEGHYLDRRERLEKRCEPLIGELERDGRTVYYITDCRGKIRESDSFYELVDFLIRNKYV